MMDLFKAFFNNKFFSYDGGFIVEAKYESLDVNAMACTYINNIIESNKRLCLLNCKGYAENKPVNSLDICFFFNVINNNFAPEDEVIKPEMVVWRSFSKSEVINFSNLVGDTNSIHYTENPVVPGLFILKELCATTQAHKIKVRYIQPVYADNLVYMQYEGNVIKGICNNRLCFEAQ